jgi:predicted DNA-binding protein
MHRNKTDLVDGIEARLEQLRDEYSIDELLDRIHSQTEQLLSVMEKQIMGDLDDDSRV